MSGTHWQYVISRSFLSPMSVGRVSENETKYVLEIQQQYSAYFSYQPLNSAGCQQWIGSPTNCDVLTTPANIIKTTTVYTWLMRSIQSSFLDPCSFLKPGIDPKMEDLGKRGRDVLGVVIHLHSNIHENSQKGRYCFNIKVMEAFFETLIFVGILLIFGNSACFCLITTPKIETKGVRDKVMLKVSPFWHLPNNILAHIFR